MTPLQAFPAPNFVNADPDFHSDADPASQNNADPDQVSLLGQRDKQEEPTLNLDPNQLLAKFAVF